MNIKIYCSLIALSLLTACGGGGGGGGDAGGGNTGGGGGGTTYAPTATISSSTSSVEVNTDFTLSWSSTYATSCTASGDWSDSIGTSGTKTFSESTAGSKTYTITCTGAGGSATDSASVTVTDPAAPTATITANVSSVLVNNSFTLTWSSTNATSCAASGSWSDSIATSGTQSVTETETGVKTYTITCTGAGGSATDSAVVTVNPAESNTAFNGFAIDGYISGANIFIDQNFNFKQDDGEYTAVTNTDGSFTIETNDSAVFACLKKRPIVADVPVGAVDSTLGGVTEAYQMILPSVEDAGTSTIVISPFTSLFAEAIITGKNNSNLVVELTVTEGCATKGDTVATNISTAITTVKNSIETNFGITYDQLLGDFVANSTNAKVTEEVAQSIASYFPSLKVLSTEVSEELTEKYETPINIDLTLNKDSLNSIFSGSAFDELPLNFNTFYRTPTSDDGWFTEDLIYTTGAKLTNEGTLKNHGCLSASASDCEFSDDTVSLNTVADAAEFFARTTFFRNNNLSNYQPFSEIQPGSVLIASNDNRNWNGSNRNCTTREDIEINGVPVEGATDKYNEYEIQRSYFAEINLNNIANCDFSNRERQVRIVSNAKPIGGGCNGAAYCLNTTYNINVLSKSRLVDNRPINFTDDYKNVDATSVIDSMLKLPMFLSEIETIRSLMTNAEHFSMFLREPTVTHMFTISTQPWSDRYSASGTGDNTEYFSQTARDKFYQAIKNSPYFSDSKYSGDAVPISDTLFRQGQPCLTIVERVSNENHNLSNYYACSGFDADTETIEFDLVGGAFDLDLVHSFLDGDTTTLGIECNLGDSGTDCGNLVVDVHLDPDDSIDTTSTLKFTLERIDDAGARLTNFGTMEINFDAIFKANDDGLTISLNAGQEINFIYTDPSGTKITKTTTNGDLDDVFIPERFDGDINVDNSIKPDIPESLSLKIDKLLALLAIGETSQVKDYFVDNGRYKFTADFGGLYVMERESRRGTKVSSKFRLKNNPPLIVGTKSSSGWESAISNVCFNANRPVPSDVTFDIVDVTPQNQRGNAMASDYSLSSNSVTIPSGQNNTCIQLTSTNDEIIYEGSEFIYFEMQNIVGAEPGLTSFNFEIFDHKSHLDPRENPVNQTQIVEVDFETNANGSGNVYVIDGIQKKSLTLNRNTTYIFNHSAAHPLRFSTTDDGTHNGGNLYTLNILYTSGQTSIYIDNDTPDTLYYYCEIHPGMGSDITIN